MSIVRVNNIKDASNQTNVSTAELKRQVIKTFRQTYRSGSWLPTTSFQWAPNCYVDYVPASASSRIRFQIAMSVAFYNAHAISHCIFYANGVEIGRHSIGGHHNEHRHLYVWDVASWGTVSGRIGYQVRNYGTSNQNVWHGTGYWDGGGSNQNAQSEIIIEEYLPI